jgi:hypothetical protein
VFTKLENQFLPHPHHILKTFIFAAWIFFRWFCEYGGGADMEPNILFMRFF